MIRVRDLQPGDLLLHEKANLRVLVEHRNGDSVRFFTVDGCRRVWTFIGEELPDYYSKLHVLTESEYLAFAERTAKAKQLAEEQKFIIATLRDELDQMRF